VELRHLECFVAVAAEMNFSRAAQRIHVVQSALSAAVGRLEKELDVELFDRSKRQIALTAPGEAFLEHAREVIQAAHRARSSVDDFREKLTGTVTLGTLMSWGTLNLPAALEEFRRANPLVTVRMRQSLSGSAGHLAAIADGQMDLAFGLDPVVAVSACRVARADARAHGLRLRHQPPAGRRRPRATCRPRRRKSHQIPRRVGNPATR
jgi:DNA-binding transcriptional LysR family regulator